MGQLCPYLTVACEATIGECIAATAGLEMDVPDEDISVARDATIMVSKVGSQVLNSGGDGANDDEVPDDEGLCDSGCKKSDDADAVEEDVPEEFAMSVKHSGCQPQEGLIDEVVDETSKQKGAGSSVRKEVAEEVANKDKPTASTAPKSHTAPTKRMELMRRKRW